MEVEHFMMHYHQTVQTVETVEIIDTDHPSQENSNHQEPAMEDRSHHQEETHQMISRTQQEPNQPNQDNNWLRRTTDTQPQTSNTGISTQRNIPNPYRPRSGKHLGRTDLSTLNAPRISSGTTLETLPSTRSDKASLGRED